MNDPRFFGYGSLVNLATHDYADPQPATLTGWRRVWVHSALRQVAFLSVEPAPGMTIAGITAAVPGGDWAALDRREAAYDRRDVTHQVMPGHDTPVATYQASVAHLAAPSDRHPILLSYIDVVVQGFLTVHGQDGAEAFFATTHGWDAPILNDRDDPRYPRHQKLTAAQSAYIDDTLKRLGSRFC